MASDHCFLILIRLFLLNENLLHVPKVIPVNVKGTSLIYLEYLDSHQKLPTAKTHRPTSMMFLGASEGNVNT